MFIAAFVLGIWLGWLLEAASAGTSTESWNDWFRSRWRIIAALFAAVLIIYYSAIVAAYFRAGMQAAEG
jgi:hypothetical protein